MDKKILENNGIILFPTDTVYGLGVLPKKEALKRLYKLKRRDESKKIVALVSSKEIAKKLFLSNDVVEDIIDRYFPGELTIIYKASDYLKNILDYEEIGVRMPANKQALDIIEKVGGILMTTSANISGNSPVSYLEQVDKEILEGVDILISTKEKLSGIASSIYRIENNNILLVRQGNVFLEK